MNYHVAMNITQNTSRHHLTISCKKLHHLHPQPQCLPSASEFPRQTSVKLRPPVSSSKQVSYIFVLSKTLPGRCSTPIVLLQQQREKQSNLREVSCQGIQLRWTPH